MQNSKSTFYLSEFFLELLTLSVLKTLYHLNDSFEEKLDKNGRFKAVSHGDIKPGNILRGGIKTKFIVIYLIFDTPFDLACQKVPCMSMSKYYTDTLINFSRKWGKLFIFLF